MGTSAIWKTSVARRGGPPKEGAPCGRRRFQICTESVRMVTSHSTLFNRIYTAERALIARSCMATEPLRSLRIRPQGFASILSYSVSRKLRLAALSITQARVAACSSLRNSREQSALKASLQSCPGGETPVVPAQRRTDRCISQCMSAARENVSPMRGG